MWQLPHQAAADFRTPRSFLMQLLQWLCWTPHYQQQKQWWLCQLWAMVQQQQQWRWLQGQLWARALQQQQQQWWLLGQFWARAPQQ